VPCDGRAATWNVVQSENSQGCERMPAKLTEEDIETEIKALESGQYKWAEPGGYVDKTKKRIKDLKKKLNALKAKKARGVT
jgi:hypothetical protein